MPPRIVTGTPRRDTRLYWPLVCCRRLAMPAFISPPASRLRRLLGAALIGVLAGCASSVSLDEPPRRQTAAPPVVVTPPVPAPVPTPAASEPSVAPVETFPIGQGAVPAAPEAAASAVPPPSGANATPATPPFGAAVAARFPDPATHYDTPGLREGREAFTTQAELQAWLHGIADARRARTAGAVKLLALGSSQAGVPLEALLFSREPSDDAAALRRAGRPTVLLVGGQHGDEPAASEALLVVARQLAEGRLNPLLDRINVIVMPRANPDGALLQQRASANGIDINRDHLLLQTPEAQALAQLARDYEPAVVVDAHEYGTFGPWVAKFGAVPRADALLQYATTPNLPPFITRAAEEWFRQPLVDALQRERLMSEWYHTAGDDPGDKLVTMGGIAADNARNVAGLENAVGFLVESRGIGLGHLHVQRRVHTQVTAMSSLLSSAAGRAADLVKLRRYLEAAIPAEACQGEIVVAASRTRSEKSLLLLDPATGADKPVTVDWDSALTLQPRLTRPRPCGYWLAADAADAVRRLRGLGLQVQQFAHNASAQGDEFRVAGSAAAGAPRPVTVPVAPGAAPLQLVDALIDLPAGSYYVPLTQPLANLAIAALEPNGPASYVAHGAIADASRIARLRVPPEASLTMLP
jgi:hypothetical protein